MRTIKESTRNITNVFISLSGYRTTDYEIKEAISVIKHFSESIKQLRIETKYLEMTDFLKILSLVPNVEHLTFKSFNTQRYGVGPPSKRPRIMSRELNLTHLKSLQMSACQDEFLLVFRRLPEGVLTELDFDNMNLGRLDVIFNRQRNIKKLTMQGMLDVYIRPYTILIPPSADTFDNLKLETLKWRHNLYGSIVDTIVAKQTNLKELSLMDNRTDEALMDTVTDNLTQLEVLSVNVTQTPVSALKNIKKLKNLKELTLWGSDKCPMTVFEEFSKLDNSRIHTLDLRYIVNMPVELVEALAKSVPNLKVARFCCDGTFAFFNAIMRNFNFVEVLQFDPYYMYFDYLRPTNQHIALLQDGCFNENLTELIIKYTWPYNKRLLKKLVRDYPNLKRLVIQSRDELSSSRFRLILRSFKKLESLTVLSGALKFTTEDLLSIKVYRPELKYILLEDLDKGLAPAVRRVLSGWFPVINEFFGLAMAVDRETMDRERR